ncbi:MAG: Omp28 family outer membrane lipoprotein [Prevotella sp.]|nr:Omp28 family outer membrane lipoprotein [Prevotella sp.]
MRILTHIAAIAAAAAIAACDSVAPEDRLVAIMDPTTVDTTHTDSLGPVARSVLMIDFTGQACVNCPNGAQVIHQLENRYGTDRLIAVGMYSGPFGRSARGTRYSLTTEQGDQYFSQWNLAAQPVSVIDYVSVSEQYTEWPTLVSERLATPSPLRLRIDKAEAAGTQADISVTAYGAGGASAGQLQLWVVEDSIVDFQIRHEPLDNLNSSINDKTYVHRHVFRTAVNGMQGDNFAIGEAEEKTFTYSIALDESWQTAHLSVVAFVYNSQGVQQACRSDVTRGN